MDRTSPHRPLAYSYVRISTDIQLKGHSKQRQLERSQDYAKKHGLRLVEAGLEDLAVSAFHGANVRDGDLGRFLRAVESGEIERGSYLLVESLDRISRQEIVKSLALFLRIIEAGINLVTLQDEFLYQAGKIQLAELVISLTSMSRAHDESLIKSQRVLAAWEEPNRSQQR